MAYELTALIGVGPAPPGTIALPQRAWLLPICDESVHNAIDLSRNSPVVFVAAQFYGGAGVQAATLYRDGREETIFETGYQAINAALHALGIAAEPPNDAFDTLGLGRFRSTEKWLSAIAPPPLPESPLQPAAIPPSPSRHRPPALQRSCRGQPVGMGSKSQPRSPVPKPRSLPS